MEIDRSVSPHFVLVSRTAAPAEPGWEVVIRDGTWLRQSPVIARDGLMILPAGKLGTVLAIEQATEGVYLPMIRR